MSARPTERGAGRLAAALDAVALAILLIALAVRPCLPEVVSYESPSWTRALDAPAGPLPATTLVFTFAMALSLLLSLLAAALRGERSAQSVIIWLGIGVLAAACVASTIRAGQKRLAINGSLNLLGCVLVLPAAMQLLATPWRKRLAAAVILATGAVVAVRCIQQVWIDFPETRAYYEQHRDELLSAVGEEQRGRLFDFEARLRSGAATGYFVHANVAASYLLLVVMVALALIADRSGREGRHALLALLAPTAVALVACTALYLCRSKGAGLALVIGLLVWTLGERAAAWLASHRRQALIGFWLIALATAAGVATLGMARGGLPTRSLLYRWQYWRGAAAMLRDHGWLGVGADNFGRLFTRYKPVECPEEVQDPHSWIVRLVAEWGLPGLCGMLLVLAGASIAIAAPRRGLHRPEPPGGPIAPWIAAVSGGAFAIWATIYSDAPFPFLAAMLGTALVIWLPLAWLVSLEPGDRLRFSNRPTTAMLPALAGGAAAFLAHTAIDLAMFVPGASCTFFAVLGMAAASHAAPPATPGPARLRSAGLISMAILLTLAAGVVVIRPAARCGARLIQARRQPVPLTWNAALRSPAVAAYASAAAADPLDATAVDELVVLLVPRARSVTECDEVAAWIERMRERDPLNAAADRHAAALAATRFSSSHDPADLRRAVDAMRAAVRAYPTSPALRLQLGGLLVQLNDVEPGRRWRAEAAEQLQMALDLDERRVYISKPHRLTPERRDAIAAEIRRLRGDAGRAGDSH